MVVNGISSINSSWVLKFQHWSVMRFFKTDLLFAVNFRPSVAFHRQESTFCTWRSCKRTHVVIETTRQFLMRKMRPSWKCHGPRESRVGGVEIKTCDPWKALEICCFWSYCKQNVVWLVVEPNWTSSPIFRMKRNEIWNHQLVAYILYILLYMLQYLQCIYIYNYIHTFWIISTCILQARMLMPSHVFWSQSNTLTLGLWFPFPNETMCWSPTIRMSDPTDMPSVRRYQGLESDCINLTWFLFNRLLLEVIRNSIYWTKTQKNTYHNQPKPVKPL